MSNQQLSAWILGALWLGSAAGRAQADDAIVAAEYRQVLKTYAPTLVTINYVPKTPGSGSDLEGENEITGVMIEPTGLVLCSNTLLGGSRFRFREGRTVPTNIRVLVGDDTEGLPAVFLARDTELDLAWLRIKEPGARKFAYLDLDAAVKAAHQTTLGQRLLALGVMGRYFGREVLVTEGHVAGRTRKPRDLIVMRGALDTDPGLPIFTPDGKVIGFACLQQPEPEELAGGPLSLMSRGRGLIVPIESVAKATVRAKEVQSEEEPTDSAAQDKDAQE
jgi:S1-C subfamily serine protease